MLTSNKGRAFDELRLFAVVMLGLFHFTVLYRGQPILCILTVAFVYAHTFMFGCKKLTIQNADGFDLVFGVVAVAFLWQNPLGFILSYPICLLALPLIPPLK